MNPFEALNTHQLIQFVQGEQLELKAKKSGASKARMRRASRLMDARTALIPRLKALDRNKPTFFPIGSHVQYQDYREAHKIYTGVVIRHGEEQLEVQLDVDGQIKFVWVWPRFLKLLYIKATY